MSGGLKSFIFLLLGILVKADETTPRTCSRSLMVALKSLYQTEDDVCVSVLINKSEFRVSILLTSFQTVEDLKSTLAPIINQIVDLRVSSFFVKYSV